MKKSIIALLLVLAVVSFGVFAADPVGPASFDVVTSVTAYSDMKLTTSAYNANPATQTDFDGTTGFTGDWDIDAQTAPTVFISAISNNRLGYIVKFDAEAMVNDDDEGADVINFTVTVGSGTSAPSFDTATDVVEDDAKTAISSGVLTGMRAISEPVGITVDSDDYAKATTGDYVGTVTFYFTSNS